MSVLNSSFADFPHLISYQWRKLVLPSFARYENPFAVDGMDTPVLGRNLLTSLVDLLYLLYAASLSQFADGTTGSRRLCLGDGEGRAR